MAWLIVKSGSLRWKEVEEEEVGSKSDRERLLLVAVYWIEGVPGGGGGQMAFITPEMPATRDGSAVHKQQNSTKRDFLIISVVVVVAICVYI